MTVRTLTDASIAIRDEDGAARVGLGVLQGGAWRVCVDLVLAGKAAEKRGKGEIRIKTARIAFLSAIGLSEADAGAFRFRLTTAGGKAHVDGAGRAAGHRAAMAEKAWDEARGFAGAVSPCVGSALARLRTRFRFAALNGLHASRSHRARERSRPETVQG